MKSKYFWSALFVLITITGAKGQSMQVTTSEAIDIAEQYLINRNEINQRNTARVIPYEDSEGRYLFYEIEESGNTVLVSGHKGCIPILGSFKTSDNSLIEGILSGNLPLNIVYFINGYIEQLEYAFEDRDTNRYSLEDRNTTNENTTINERIRVSEVLPLLSTRWGQSNSNAPYSVPNAYNYQTPPGEGCLHSLVGCVAVAMGQVMKYWQYPVLDTKLFTQFDWCNMSNILMSTDPDYEIQRGAISYLLYHCGVSVDMDFGCESSGASMINAKNALKDIYDYESGISLKYKYLYTDDDWRDMLQVELNNSRPVIYAANRYEEILEWPGHAFVCDGYRDNEFHFNWGWNGAFDGYFTIDSLRPTDDRFYKYNHSAIIKISPRDNSDICEYNLNLGYFYESFYSISSHSGVPPYQVTPQTMTKLVSAGPSSPISWRTIPYGATATYQAHEEVLLQDGFTVEEGAEFTAQIVPCPNCENRGEGVVEEGPGDSNANPQGADTEEVLNARPSFLVSLTDLYPNPTSGEVIVTMEDEVQGIILYNTQGQPVGGWKILSLAGNRATLDVSALSAGPYLVRIATPRGTVTKKLVVQRR